MFSLRRIEQSVDEFNGIDGIARRTICADAAGPGLSD